MDQLNYVNRSIAIILYISLALRFVSCNQEAGVGGVQPEEKLQTFREDANQPLESVDRNLNQDFSHNDLLNSFDSSIYYEINWKERPDDLVLNEGNESIVTLTPADLSEYHCVLPKIDQQEQSQKEDANIDPYTKIEKLFEQKSCFYKLDSYWTYEMCLNDHIRQFNGDILEKKHTQEYYLGHFKSSNLENDRQAHNRKVAQLKSQGKAVPKIDYDGTKVPYVYLTMDKGTICDLTGKPRQTKVYFVCDKHEKPQLESIEEVQSCEYEAIVSTHLLCDHPDFKEKKENELQINCFPDSNEGQPIKPVGESQYDTISTDLYSETILQQIHEMMSNSKLKIEIEPMSKGNTRIRSVDKSKFIENLEPREMTVESFMKAKHCYTSTYKTYWKYKFCFKKSIKMFHEENGEKTKIISLGKFDQDKHLNWLKYFPDKRKTANEVNYLFSDGDICHETNRLRYVEVKLRCPSSESIHPILTLKEPELCEYKLTVETDLVCKLLDVVDENGL